jgi:hypothetical protein
MQYTSIMLAGKDWKDFQSCLLLLLIIFAFSVKLAEVNGTAQRRILGNLSLHETAAASFCKSVVLVLARL